MLDIKPVPAFRDNYIWLVIDRTTCRVAIVDPGDPAPVLDAIRAGHLVPAAILITHHHHDHIGGIEILRQHYPIPVHGPADGSIPGITHPLREGDTLTLSGIDLQFTIMAVPGHTLEHIAYYGSGRLLIGDTLFMAGCGRLFNGTAEQLYHSLNRVAKLPNDTLIYCAHEYTLANLRFAQTVEPDNRAITERIGQCTDLCRQDIPTIPATLAIEKATNPFLRTDVPAVIAAVEKFAGRKLDRGVDVFTQLRKWKDRF